MEITEQNKGTVSVLLREIQWIKGQYNATHGVVGGVELYKVLFDKNCSKKEQPPKPYKIIPRLPGVKEIRCATIQDVKQMALLMTQTFIKHLIVSPQTKFNDDMIMLGSEHGLNIGELLSIGMIHEGKLKVTDEIRKSEKMMRFIDGESLNETGKSIGEIVINAKSELAKSLPIGTDGKVDGTKDNKDVGTVEDNQSSNNNTEQK